MLLKLFLLALLVINGSAGKSREPCTTEEYITHHGYPVEEHSVVTPDGFTLTLFRIPGIKGSTPVYLQHGLVDSSDSWFCMGKNHSLGFLLSDAGFDVWAGNFRGNVYSAKHEHFSPDMPEYWDFSWDTLGLIDVRMMIQYILQESEQEQLIHIGHSMGTTSFFVAASYDPQINERVKAHIALAPIVSFQYSTSPAFSAKFIEPLLTTLQSHGKLQQKEMQESYFEAATDALDELPVPSGVSTLADYYLKSYVSPVSQAVDGYGQMVSESVDSIRQIVPDYLGLNKLSEVADIALDHGEVRGSLLREYCQMSLAHEKVCLRSVMVVQGDDEHHLNQELSRLMFRVFPKSASLKEVKHYLQQRRAGKLFYYDYKSRAENMKEYGTPNPPEVNFKRIKVPVYFIYGPNDLFTSEQDLHAAYEKFGNPAGIFPVGRMDWNHVDFLITIDIQSTLSKMLVLNIVKDYKTQIEY